MADETKSRPHEMRTAPLCVDLDGTLVKSDTLLDAAMALWRKQPLSPLQWPGWVAKGKAALKREINQRVELDVEHLPYNQPLLEYLKQEHAAGRAIYLATAADAALAQRIADHLGVFTGVLASDGTINLAGKNKLAAFEAAFPEGFTYIGNAIPDRPLLAKSLEPMVANPHGSLLRALKKDRVEPARRFQDKSSSLKAFIKAIRLHQWAKNVLVFLPAILAHKFNWNTMSASLTAFFSMSFCASATYIINDLLDIEADRKHPRKRRRAFAAGDLSPISGIVIVGAFFVLAIGLAVSIPFVFHAMPGPLGVHEVLPRPYFFLLWLGLYTVTTLTYSIWLKRKLLVDVLCLAGLYTVRIVGGSAATGVPISAFLGAFSIFLFTSLALVKRFSELDMLLARNEEKVSGRGYRTSDLEQVRSFGTAAAMATVVVLTMYLSSLESMHMYRHVHRLWLLIPVLLLWLMRVWMLASRGEMHEDPVVFAITDKPSWILGVVTAVVVWAATLQ